MHAEASSSTHPNCVVSPPPAMCPSAQGDTSGDRAVPATAGLWGGCRAPPPHDRDGPTTITLSLVMPWGCSGPLKWCPCPHRLCHPSPTWSGQTPAMQPRTQKATRSLFLGHETSQGPSSIPQQHCPGAGSCRDAGEGEGCSTQHTEGPTAGLHLDPARELVGHYAGQAGTAPAEIRDTFSAHACSAQLRF